MRNITYSIYRKTPLPRCLAVVQRGVDLKYNSPNKTIKADLFTMIDTKTKECVGHMYTQVCRNINHDDVYPFVKNCDSLCIEELQIKEPLRRKGYGSEFIKLAQTESREQNCKGRVHLVATSSYDPENPSFIFYRKKGFTTSEPDINDMLDKSIKQNKKPNLMPMYMYLPIGDKIKGNIFLKIRNFINKLSERKS